MTQQSIAGLSRSAPAHPASTPMLDLKDQKTASQTITKIAKPQTIKITLAKEDLKCPVTKSYFFDPFVLKTCGHAVESSVLAQITKDKKDEKTNATIQVYRCPTCRKESIHASEARFIRNLCIDVFQVNDEVQKDCSLDAKFILDNKKKIIENDKFRFHVEAFIKAQPEFIFQKEILNIFAYWYKNLKAIAFNEIWQQGDKKGLSIAACLLCFEAGQQFLLDNPDVAKKINVVSILAMAEVYGVSPLLALLHFEKGHMLLMKYSWLDLVNTRAILQKIVNAKVKKEFGDFKKDISIAAIWNSNPSLRKKFPQLSKLNLGDDKQASDRVKETEPSSATFDIEVPTQDLTCPITKKLFVNPVVNCCPEVHVFEREAWWSIAKCPCCTDAGLNDDSNGQTCCLYFFMQKVSQQIQEQHPELEEEFYLDQTLMQELLKTECKDPRREKKLNQIVKKLKFSPALLNKGTAESIQWWGMTCVGSLLTSPKGAEILSNDTVLRNMINAEGLNTIAKGKGGLRAGWSGVYGLIRDMNPKNNNLFEDARFINLITPDALLTLFPEDNMSALDLAHQKLDHWQALLKKHPLFRRKLLTAKVCLDPMKTFKFYYAVFEEDIKDSKCEDRVKLAELITAQLDRKKIFDEYQASKFPDNYGPFFQISAPPQKIYFVFRFVQAHGFDWNPGIDHLKNFLAKKYNPNSDKKNLLIGKIDIIMHWFSNIFQERPENFLIYFLCGFYQETKGWASVIQRLIIEGHINQIEFLNQALIGAEASNLMDRLKGLLDQINSPEILHSWLKHLLSQETAMIQNCRVEIFKYFAGRILDCIEAERPLVKQDIETLFPYTKMQGYNPKQFPDSKTTTQNYLDKSYQELFSRILLQITSSLSPIDCKKE